LQAPVRPAEPTVAYVRLAALTAYHPWSSALGAVHLRGGEEVRASAAAALPPEVPGAQLTTGAVAVPPSGRERRALEWRQKQAQTAAKTTSPEPQQAAAALTRSRDRLLSQEEIKLREARAAESQRIAEATAKAYRERHGRLGTWEAATAPQPAGPTPEDVRREIKAELDQEQAPRDRDLAELETVMQKHLDLELGRLEKDLQTARRRESAEGATAAAELRERLQKQMEAERPAPLTRAEAAALSMPGRAEGVAASARAARTDGEKKQRELAAALATRRAHLQELMLAETRALVTRLALERNIVVYFDPHKGVADKTQYFVELVRAHWAAPGAQNVVPERDDGHGRRLSARRTREAG
jgi:hypothetical protein